MSETLVTPQAESIGSPSRANKDMIVEHPFGQRFPYSRIITTSQRLQNILNEATRVARSHATVLICGESGTGKELLATEIHRLSRRATKPLTIVNCAALSEQLVETELFGHVRGAFTGADRARVGFFEAADSGTVFLDEIGEIGPVFQLKLLRVLEQGEFNRVGDIHTYYTDIRFIAATNQNLEAKVREGKFREDLYYRLNVVALTLPPLRERKEDIGILARYFVQMFAREMEKRITWIAREVLDSLEFYDWPGNVRQLRNIIYRAVILCDGDTLTLDTLPSALHGRRSLSPEPVLVQGGGFDEQDFLCSFKEAKEKFLGQFEKEYLTFHLKLNRGNIARTAQRTGIYGANLYEKLRRYHIDPNQFRPSSKQGTLVPLTHHVI
jgi:transcriptional regulator with GAF, ATPase, and Fis domain